MLTMLNTEIQYTLYRYCLLGNTRLTDLSGVLHQIVSIIIIYLLVVEWAEPSIEVNQREKAICDTQFITLEWNT